MKVNIFRYISFFRVTWLSLLICIGFFAPGLVFCESQHKEKIIIAVRAHSGAEAAIKKWQATADYLSLAIPEYRFELLPLVTFDNMRRALAEEQVHFVLTNPTAYVDLEVHYGITRLATLLNLVNNVAVSEFGSVIFTRADKKDINALVDIRGKSFMGVDKEAFGAWLMARRELEDNGIFPFKHCRPLFAGTQEAVVFAVRDGEADVGTVRTGVMEKLAREGRIDSGDFKIINQIADSFPYPHSTRLYPEWPFSRTRQTSEELSAKVAIALLSMPPNAPAARDGRYHGWGVPMDYARVHDILRQLRVTPYQDYGNITILEVVREYLWWLTAIILLVLIGFVLFIRTSYLNQRLKNSKIQLEKASENLEKQVRSRTVKLVDEVVERKRAEEALRDEQQFLQTIFDTMEEGIVACDANGMLTRFNQATRRFHGLPEEALPAEQWAQYYDLYQPDGKTPMNKEDVPLYRALCGEKVMDAEMMIIPKEGQPKTLIANGQPLHDSGGKIVGAVITMHDITESKRVNEALTHSHDLMRYIIEHNRSAIAVHDRDLKYIYVSQSYLNDYKLKEQDIIGKHHYDVFPDLSQKWRDIHQKALAGEVSSAEADPYEREDGSVEWTRWECRPWYEADGSVGGIIVYTEVVTKRKKAEDELKQYRDHLEELVLERTLDVEGTQNALLNLLDDMNMAKEQLEAANERLQGLDRMKSMFVASMSHELRTPLNSIIGFSSILLEGWDGEINEVQEDNLRRILRSGKHLLSLINDVIDVSKLEAGTIAFNIEEFDFQEVCGEAESMVQAELEGKGLDFRIEVVPAAMRTDRRRLFQVVLNLLTNAIKFTDKGYVSLKARITEREHIAEELGDHFSAGVQGQFLEVTVEDSGIGIEKQDFNKLFKPFSRLHDSGRSRYPGTGLGLYLTQKLVQEILQGAITFTSVSGQGSTFMFAIPCRIDNNEN